MFLYSNTANFLEIFQKDNIMFQKRFRDIYYGLENIRTLYFNFLKIF